MTGDPSWLPELRAGARSLAPMLPGVLPVALLVGAAAVAAGLGGEVGIALSVLVFGGTSQLAFIDVANSGGSALVAVAAALVVNLRYLLYSASIAPYLSTERLGRRVAAGYVMTDQSYAVALTRWRARREGAGSYFFYFGASVAMWATWQIGTVTGVLVGPAVPDDVPLDFAVPLMFMALLIAGIDGRSTVTSAVVGGTAAVLVAEAGLAPVAILIGSLAGIVAGSIVAGRSQKEAQSRPGRP